MRFAVETWAPEFGTAGDGTELEPSGAAVEVGVEVPPEEWAPVDPRQRGRVPYHSVLFIDGVQRVDARVWVVPHGGPPHLGVCASWAAGAVHCDGVALVVAAEVRRGALCRGEGLDAIVTGHGTYAARPVGDSADDPLQDALGRARGELEARVAVEAAAASPAELVVVDGPLGDRRHIPGALGYIKSHHVTYLPAPLQATVTALAPGGRTPLFRIGDARYRYSFYARLPGPLAHPYAGVVRCELAGELPLPAAVEVADRATVTLPRYATRAHQDPRAPQNLHPIAGLERHLRHRLGDPALLERALRRAAADSS